MKNLESLTIRKQTVILSEGRTWVEQRRFALRTLRDFGFGKQGMEEMTQEEVIGLQDLDDAFLRLTCSSPKECSR